MTPKPPRPGAHGEPIPADSHAFIVECGPLIGQVLESEAEHRHMEALFPKPTTRRLQTVTVEITMEVRGDLTRHINAALDSIPTAGGRKDWTYLDG